MQKTFKVLAVAVSILANTVILSQEIKTEMFAGLYQSSDYLPSEDGDYVQVNFKNNAGKAINFIEEAGVFMGDKAKEMEFTAKNENGNNITHKLNVGVEYIITYYTDGMGHNIIKTFTPLTPNAASKAKEDSTLKVIKKSQNSLSAQNKCPSCPIESAKSFIKVEVEKAKKENNPKGAKSIIALETALKGDRFIVYYFSNKRASVLVNEKIGSKYVWVQLRKESNKWVAIGIDDRPTSCHELKPEDKVSQKEAADCILYFDNAVKVK